MGRSLYSPLIHSVHIIRPLRRQPPANTIMHSNPTPQAGSPLPTSQCDLGSTGTPIRQPHPYGLLTARHCVMSPLASAIPQQNRRSRSA
ncbi:hypothetical protein FA15DRAFT_674370 [Coprinopsis marcescibilis]|uniref:Uncharacterized protein n=1 Tax=Coprinopsis marcescibilis TaxID=230819 RepID=A0A5C3KHG8_COPMA|nr:hypothetical protein FA15DRAFT_674370 [Coprinopsis marcescibilis]